MKKIQLLKTFFIFIISTVAFSQDGQFDTSFNGGFVQTDTGGFDFGLGIGQQADGKILAVGTAEDSDEWAPAILRYHVDGNLDTSFGATGIVTTDISAGFGIDAFWDVIVQEDQKIIAGGYTGSPTTDIMLVRYLPNGDLDPTFGVNGIVTTDMGDDDSLSEIAMLDDGKILAVGSLQINGGGGKLTILRYMPDGSLDPTFGDNGMVVTNSSAPTDGRFQLNLLENNKFLVGGLASGAMRLFKFEADGSADVDFGDNGITLVGSSPFMKRLPFDITSENKIVVALRRTNSNDESECYLKRFLPDGNPDVTFGGDGEVIIDYNNLRPSRIVVQPNQRILIFGDAYYGVDSVDAILTRYRMTGLPDNTFGQSSIAKLSEVNAEDMMLQDDGKIIWVGWSNFSVDYVVARFTNDPLTFGMEDQILKGLSVVPNPSSNVFTLQYDYILNEGIPYQINDISGKVLLQGKLSGNQHEVDLSNLGSGLYFLNAAQTTLRLVKE